MHRGQRKFVRRGARGITPKIPLRDRIGASTRGTTKGTFPRMSSLIFGATDGARVFKYRGPLLAADFLGCDRLIS